MAHLIDYSSSESPVHLFKMSEIFSSPTLGTNPIQTSGELLPLNFVMAYPGISTSYKLYPHGIGLGVWYVDEYFRVLPYSEDPSGYSLKDWYDFVLPPGIAFHNGDRTLDFVWASLGKPGEHTTYGAIHGLSAPYIKFGVNGSGVFASKAEAEAYVAEQRDYLKLDYFSQLVDIYNSAAAGLTVELGATGRTKIGPDYDDNRLWNMQFTVDLESSLTIADLFGINDLSYDNFSNLTNLDFAAHWRSLLNDTEVLLKLTSNGDSVTLKEEVPDKFRVNAGSGNDYVLISSTNVFDASSDIRVDGGDGNDDIRVKTTSSAYLTGGTGDDILFANSPNSSVPLILFGNGGSDTLIVRGRSGAKISGNAGADTLKGAAGGDTIIGGSGNDNLRGNKGDDQLKGGTGADLLGGGTGSDIFVFGSLSDSLRGRLRDQITDFQRGYDNIDLQDIDANTKLRGYQSFDFNGKTPDDYSVWYSSGRTGSSIFADVNGDARADFEIWMQGVSRLSEADFLI